MKLHELKIKYEYLVEVASGKKTFELRKNDRDYQEGDLIRFIEAEEYQANETKKLLGNVAYNINSNDLYKITYVLKYVPQYGLDPNYCILGIKKLVFQEQ